MKLEKDQLGQPLPENAEELRLLIANVVDYAIFTLDRSGCFKGWSPGAERLFGYSEDEIVGRSVALIFTPEDRQQGIVEQEMQKAATQGRAGDDRWHLRRDGSRFFANGVMVPLRDDDGILHGYAKIMRDLTAKRQAEIERENLLQRIKEEHDRTVEVIESISDIFYAIDETFHFTYINRKAEEAWGRQREELIGQELWSIFPAETDSDFYRMHLQAIKERQPIKFEMWWELLQRWVAVNLHPARDGGLSAYVHNIDEHKQVQEARNWLAGIVESSTDGIISFTPDMTIVSWNRGAERIFGYSEAEAVGQSVTMLAPPELAASQQELIRTLQSGQHLEQHETKRRRKNGEIFDVSLTASQIRSVDGTVLGATSIVQDITGRKAAEAELLRLKTELAMELSAMTRLHEIGSRLVSASDLQPLLTEILRAAIELQGADFGTIQFLDRQHDELEIVAQHGFEEGFLNRFKRVSATQGAAGLAFSRRERVMLQDVQNDPHYLPFRETALAAGFRTIVCTPLFDRSGEPLGMLTTHFREPHRPAEAELRLTDLFARQAAEMIGLRRAEDALVEKSNGLQLLFDIAAQLLTTRDIDSLLNGLHQRLLGLIDISAYFHFRTVDSDPEHLHLAAWGGVGEEVVAYAREVRYDSTICGLVAQIKEPIVLKGVAQSTDPRTTLIRYLGVESYASFPLMTQNGIYGTLSFARRDSNGFSSDNLSLLRSICDLIATAIERREAEEALRESETRFRAVVDLIPDLLWGNTADGTTDWYNQRWLEYTGQTFAEAINGDWLDWIHPDDRANSLQHFENSLRTGENLRQEHRIRGVDGVYRWFLVQARPVQDEQGEIRRWYGAATDIDDIRNAEAELRRTHEELEARVQERTAELAAADEARRRLMRQLVTAQEEEQGRIAREIHDQMGQYLTVLILGLNNLKDRLAAPAQTVPAQTVPAQTVPAQTVPDENVNQTGDAETIEKLLALAGELDEKAHHLAVALRPTALDDLGLAAALQNYVQEWSQWSKIPVDLECIGFDRKRVSSEIETTIYRIVQEALTNVLRHGTGTTRVSVIAQRSAREILAIVEDNGQGFDTEVTLSMPAERRRLGLFGMRERAALVGGTFVVESQPGQGTTVRLRIPLSAE